MKWQMSLHWRILGSFILIVLLTVLLSFGVAYWSTQSQLTNFTREIASEEANQLARTLSQGYTFAGGWATLEQVLFETGYFYDEVLVEEWLFEIVPVDDTDIAFDPEIAEGAFEFFYQEPVRVVVVDLDDTVLMDSFFEFETGDIATTLDGQRATVIDLRTEQPVGSVYVNVDRDFLASESATFLEDTLYTTASGGLLTIIIALLLAIWLSQRITAPVTALTQATQNLAQHGDTQLLPVTSSDELGQMSAAFNQMTSALQTQRDLRKRLINDVSHELNTPLSVIQLETKGLRDGFQSSDEAADHIMEEINRLRTLVHDLNWLGETDSGELRMTLEPYSLTQLLETEVERWQVQAQAQETILSLQPLPLQPLSQLPPLNLDPMRMSQAIGNLLRNALQHTAVGEHVTVSMTQTASHVTVTVADEGVGIDPTDLPHLFERFYRTDQSRSRGTGGSGLGLAITRTIIEGHHGTIEIFSDGVGQGTQVCFSLPL
ncbi:MAG: HAMP domain-containing sensor histidine kinase [Chloroflexota bacterium]